MGRPSSIRRLPPELRERLDEWLRDQSLTQQEAAAQLNEHLSARELPPVSRSAVNRYAMSMEKVGERMRQSREMADVWIAKLGSQPSGKVGQLIIDMLKTLVYEVNLKLQDVELDSESMPGVTRQLRELSLTAQRLEQASYRNEKRESEVRERARREAAEAAAEAAGEAASEQGLSAETVGLIKRKILGVGA
ncbi:MAG: DUF3486 family protein [Rhodospirillaceae bacterium]|nr:DUF3486 family protein [Rhodospirillaceae bacterium]